MSWQLGWLRAARQGWLPSRALGWGLVEWKRQTWQKQAAGVCVACSCAWQPWGVIVIKMLHPCCEVR